MTVVASAVAPNVTVILIMDPVADPTIAPGFVYGFPFAPILVSSSSSTGSCGVDA